jgi:tetratricopeptide (TPR) repeat protein
MRPLRWGFRAAGLVLVAGLGYDVYRAISFDLRMHTAEIDYRGGRYTAALSGFQSARRLHPSDPLVWAWIGDAADAEYRSPPAAGWDADRARRILASAWGGYAGAVLRSPTDTWSWSGLAETAILFAERRDADNGVDLAEIERRAGGRLDSWRGVAFVAAEIAVWLKPSGYQELDVLTHVYRSAGQVDRARDTAVRSARIMPAPSLHSWGEGEQLVGPLYDAIIGATLEGLRGTPAFERSGLHRDIGRFAMAQGDYGRALKEMRAALETADTTSERYLAGRGIAQVLEEMGRIDEAIAAWGEVLRSPLAVASDRRQRGIDLVRAKRNEEACADLREAMRDDPGDASQRRFAAASCESAGDLQTAERLLRDGFAVPTENPTLARALLDFYVRTGKTSTARGLLQSWVRDYPDHEEFQTWTRDLNGDQR